MLNLRNGHFTSQICRERERNAQKYKKAREGRAKLLFLFIKYANFVESLLPLRRRSLARVPNTTARDQYMAKLKKMASS